MIATYTCIICGAKRSDPVEPCECAEVRAFSWEEAVPGLREEISKGQTPLTVLEVIDALEQAAYQPSIHFRKQKWGTRMHLDENGLPCTLEENGTLDKNDQLQRVAALYLVGWSITAGEIRRGFEREPGVYVRYPDQDRTTDLSGDQLISILAAFVGNGDFQAAWAITKQIVKRKGFAQNIHDMYGRTEIKTPDFILIRAYSLMWRSSRWLMELRGILFLVNIPLIILHSLWWSVALLFTTDLFLLIGALMAGAPVWKDDKGFAKRTSDDVDDTVQILTYLACARNFKTPMSALAPRIFAKLRPWNLGCTKDGNASYYGPVIGSMRWYHRLPKGNWEIAKMYAKDVEKYFGEKNPEVVP